MTAFREDASAQDHLDQGRKLVATDQYPGAMRCLLRAMETGKGTSSIANPASPSRCSMTTAGACRRTLKRLACGE